MVPPINRGVWAFIARVGVPSAIALFLVYVLANSVTTNISAMKDELRLHTDQSATTLQSIVALSSQRNTETATLTILMRQICINTASSNEQRRECVR